MNLNKQNKLNISVIVMTYNANLKKLLVTLNSIIKQKNVSFEIIVTDDGSEINYFSEVEECFTKHNFTSYTLIANGTNQGTVKNLLGAMNHVKAPYVKIISPGDYLYNETTLFDTISFMNKHDLSASFGKAVYYSNEPDFQVYNELSHPLFTQLYNPENYNYKKIISVMVGSVDLILGAAIVYKSEVFKQCLTLLENHVKLCEDFAMQIIALKKLEIGYIDNYVVWYEFGAGVSTNPKLGLLEQTHSDLFSFYKLALNKWPREKALKRAQRYMHALYSNNNLYFLFTKYSDFKQYAYYLRKGQQIKNFKTSPFDKTFFDTINKVN